MELSTNLQAVMADVQEAVNELLIELDRLSQNQHAFTQYQTSVLQVSKILCAWMENMEALAQHRKKTRLH